MGCFSFICKNSDEPILSSSFDGDGVHLFLLKGGKVIEKMFGNYDSYGRVFKEDGDPFEWKMGWSDVCDLMFDIDKSNGIAAILAPYWKKGDQNPTIRSKYDPDQGWGSHKDLPYLEISKIEKQVKNPKHEVY